ncbi:ABC transporter permease [Viridibacillus sp. NPDC093762]|uniref:ABC transporter permease n=1 Tax=Viridibacillus sp. NPDC093762 TaxID=3390720 RepID=UPI003D04FA3A
MTFNHIVLQNILRDKWTYIAYFLSSVFSIFIFFSFSVSMFHPDLSIIQNGSALSLAMMAGNVLVYLFSFIFISYSVMSFMHMKQKTLGLFVIMGASNKQIKKMVFRENMFIGIIAILTAIIMGLLFAPLFLMITKKIMNVEGFAMYFPMKAIVLTSAMFLVLFLVISLITPFFIRKQQIIRLLKSDKKSEREVRLSPIKLLLGLVTVGFSLVAMTIKNDASFIRPLVDSDFGVIVLLIIFLMGLYPLYMQLSLLSITIVQKTNYYLQRTNMLTVSGLKSKIRSNVKIMYLVSLLLMGSFFSIVMLYSANANVEDSTKANYPFSFMYVSNTGNAQEKEHVGLLQSTLENERGYQSYKFDVLCNLENRSQSFISQSDYNQAVQGINGKPVALKQDEVYIVSGNSRIHPNLEISTQFQQVFKKADIKPQVVGSASQNLMPTGYLSRLLVVSDEAYSKINQLNMFNHINVFAYNISDWKENIKLAETLETKIHIDSDVEYGQNFGFFSAGNLYATDKNAKNLMFYIGFMLSLIFMIAALSMIYFRLITDFDKEREMYKGIMKMGLSKKELSTVVSKQLFVLMFVPFIVASVFLFIGVDFLEEVMGGSLQTIAIYSFGVFFTIQLLGYLIVNRKYRKTLITELAK